MDVAGVVFGLVIAIAWAEASAWLPPLTHQIIRAAAKRLDSDLQSRLEEEWLRYVQDTPGTLGPFFAGCQCLLASIKIRPVRIRLPARRLHPAAQVRKSINRVFSDREFFIHDGRRLRRFRVSASIQAFFFFLSAVLVGWSGYSAAQLFTAA